MSLSNPKGTTTAHSSINITATQDSQCTYKVTLRRVRATIVVVEKQFTQLECVFVALGIQYAICMRRIVICDLPRSTKFFHITS